MERPQREDPLMGLIYTESLRPLLSSIVLWLGASLLLGALANQVPLDWLCQSSHTPSPRVVALILNWYERLFMVRRWRNWIPDAGRALPGGISKDSLVRRDLDALQRFVAETRRAELVHWLLLPLWLLTPLWLSSSAVVLNLIFATLFNVPCLVLQRYNRLRLQRLIGRHPLRLGSPTLTSPFRLS